MARIFESVLLPFQHLKIYEIVNDVGSYPDFLPWCVDSEVIEEGEDSMRASITISKGGFSYSLTTYNRLVPGLSITMDFSEGPFKYLGGKWIFEELRDGCRAQLELDFEAESKVLDLALGAASRPVAAKLMQSFKHRAHSLLD